MPVDCAVENGVELLEMARDGLERVGHRVIDLWLESIMPFGIIFDVEQLGGASGVGSEATEPVMGCSAFICAPVSTLLWPLQLSPREV